MSDRFDVTAAGFAESFVTHLRANGEMHNTCVIHERPLERGVFYFREFMYSNSPVLDESNFEVATAALGKCAGFDADNCYLTALDADGKPTAALVRLAELMNELDDYPVLDESDYSDRQCDHAGEHGLDTFGDDVFADWRNGELTKCAGWCGDPDVVPAPDVQPDAASYAELEGDALAFIQGHAQCRYLESECCY